MPRMHALEWEDLAWFPPVLRNLMTDYLQHISNVADLWQGIVPLLADAMRRTGDTQIVDMASGGGGGLLRVTDHLADEIPGLRVQLSDYYPNVGAFEATVARKPDVFAYVPDSVDATNVPADLQGFRTQFLSLHHFRPAAARQILQNAVDAGVGIGLFEAQKRDLRHVITFALSPIFVILLSWMITPFKVSRIVFTYLFPIVPLLVGWDGVASALRTYDTDEMQALVDSLDGGDRYDWQIGLVQSGQMVNQYLIGVPKD